MRTRCPCLPRATLLLTLCLLVSACATQRTPEQVDDLLSQTLEAAWLRHQGDMNGEAVILSHAVAAVDPDFTGLAELEEALGPELSRRMNGDLLGINRRMRPPVERSLTTRVLLWLPDRLLDLLDVATFDVHFGFGAYVDAHATRALQAGGGFRSTGGIGLHEGRSIGLKSRTEAGLSVIAAGAHSYAGANLGTSGLVTGAGHTAGLFRPTDPLYHQLLDYWAIGGGGTAGIVGADWDLHPVQLVDFLAGFVGIDFLNDDLARTRRLDFDAVESTLLDEIWKVRRSGKTLRAYRTAFAADPSEPADANVSDPPAPERPASGNVPAAPVDPE